jgi:hypothetical protein
LKKQKTTRKGVFKLVDFYSTSHDIAISLSLGLVKFYYKVFNKNQKNIIAIKWKIERLYSEIQLKVKHLMIAIVTR